MPLLGGLLVSLFGSIAGFFVKFFSAKVAMGLATVATLGVLLGGLLTLMRVTINSISPSITESNFGVGLGLAIPPNASACFTAFFTMWTACTLYTWKKKALDLFNAA